MNKTSVVMIALFCVGYLLNSCNAGGQYKHEVSVVDSLQISLDEVVSDYRKWDIKELNEIKQKVDVNLTELTKIVKLNMDTLTREQAILLGDYKSSTKVFKDVNGRNKGYVEAITLSESQLALLKSDLKNGAITNPDSLTLYMASEKKFVGGLIEDLQRANRGFNMGREKYKMINPTVEHILDSLKNRNDN